MKDWIARLFAAQRRQWDEEHGGVFDAPTSFRAVGDVLTITVGIEASYPDAVAEARANARALYADALDITLADAETGTDPDVI